MPDSSGCIIGNAGSTNFVKRTRNSSTVVKFIHLSASRWCLRAWFSLAAVWLACAGLAGAAQLALPTKPNILVILTDDQGRGDYSAFGTKDIRTPNMDRLFKEGMTFNNFFANSCVCSPSRAALLTGCYPDRVGVPGVIREETPDDSWGYLLPTATLLPQLLK